MTQERVFNELKLKGECRHEWYSVLIRNPASMDANWVCDKCKLIGGFAEYGDAEPATNLDLTTEKGAYWLLKRLSDWSRLEQFIEYIIWKEGDSLYNKGMSEVYNSDVIEEEEILKIISTVFTWLGEDSANLYNAIDEFLEVKDERDKV